MNTVSGDYQIRQPESGPLTGIELSAAILVAGMMWIGTAQFECSADPIYTIPYWPPPSTENHAFTSPVAIRVEQAKAASHLIDALARLEDNWDGYRGSAISKFACDNARSFIRVIEAAPFDLQFPDISPKAAGTISLAWDMPDAEVYFEIGDSDFSGYISPEGQPTTYLQGRANELNQRIVGLIQAAVSLPTLQNPTITDIQFSAASGGHVAN
jgi:hypothetical protein